MQIGTNIYTLRKAKKLTQAGLAQKLGVSEQSVSKWENGMCAPDVSLFPRIADCFGVSIDRLFGYDRTGYMGEVEKILKSADDSGDTAKEIEILSEGLQKFPNSSDLKLALSFSLLMVNRISGEKKERDAAVKKAARLCQEVIADCEDTEKTDNALNLLARIYIETQNYGKAEECISKISADRYDARTVGIMELLGYQKRYAEQEQYAENALWKMYRTMHHVFEYATHSMIQRGENEKALAFLSAQEKLLAIFDEGCADFCMAYKLFVCAKKANAYKNLGEKENCRRELARFSLLAEQVKKVAESTDFKAAVRNPVYFSGLDGEILEEYMPAVDIERMLRSYDGFLGDDEAYRQCRKDLTVTD